MTFDRELLVKVVKELIKDQDKCKEHPVWAETGPNGALAEIMIPTESAAILNHLFGKRMIGTIGTCIAMGFYLGIRYAEELRKREAN